jgi:hypothetical protein
MILVWTCSEVNPQEQRTSVSRNAIVAVKPALLRSPPVPFSRSLDPVLLSLPVPCGESLFFSLLAAEAEGEAATAAFGD